MASVNITLDTETRQVGLMIDGVTIPNAEISFDYFFIEEEDGEMEKLTRFEFSVMETNDAGLQEKRVFRLPPPPPEDEGIALMPNGLAALSEQDVINQKVASWYNKRKS